MVDLLQLTSIYDCESPFLLSLSLSRWFVRWFLRVFCFDGKPTEYLNKLPDSFSPDDKILVSDPMLATGKDYIRERERESKNMKKVKTIHIRSFTNML